MKWMKYSIETTVEGEDAVCALLMNNGIDALEIVDNEVDPASIEKEGGFYEELMPDLPTEDKTARVIFYMEEGAEESKALFGKVEEGLNDLRETGTIGSGRIEISVSDEDDWRDNWKSYFHAFRIGELLIKPSWEPLPTEGAGQVIEIDPGISFGTGQHETTKMCIEWMQQYLKQGDTVLDVGFGSGILSIAALVLGAAKVVGTDIDADCLSSVESNFVMNHLAKERAAVRDGRRCEIGAGRFYIGDLRTDEALAGEVGSSLYDLAVANILADIVIDMRGRLFDALRFGGILICSGIIDFKEDAVTAAFDGNGFEVIGRKAMGEWVSLAARKV